MRRVLSRGIVFSSPIIICFIIITVIDPYCYFKFNNLIPGEKKREYARPLNFALWDMIQYSRNPSKDILIGDSRMGTMNTDLIKTIAKKDFYKFSFGGGNLREIITVINYLRDVGHVKSLYIGVNLELYNKTNNRDRVSGAIDIMKNPLLYLVNLNVWQATYEIIISQLFGDSNQIGEPELSKEKFWKYQIEKTGARNLSNYIYPDNYKSELNEIGSYCKQNGIDFRIIIFPTHVDIQSLFDKYHLIDEYNTFLSDICAITTVYDLNFPNYITKDENYFSDPYHIHRELFGQKYTPILLDKVENNDSIVRVYQHNSHYIYTTFKDL